jgi:chaperonin GroES
MPIKPLRDLIAVDLDPEASVSKGGVMLPQGSSVPGTGTVVAVGPGELKPDGSMKTLGLVPGDRVLFTRGVGTKVRVDGEWLQLIKSADILARA